MNEEIAARLRRVGPSIPEPLAAAVGPTGHVLATDINPGWLNPHGGYEVLRHDVVADPPPEPGAFDLAHALLVHVPDRARALAAMVAAPRPGAGACRPAAAGRPGVDDPPRR